MKTKNHKISALYWVYTVIITACYTGSIVAFITMPVYPDAIETSEELLDNRYRIGTLSKLNFFFLQCILKGIHPINMSKCLVFTDHNGWEQWFNLSNTDDPFLHKLFRKIEYVPTILEGVQNASRAFFWPYAFLASRTALDYFVQTDFAPT